MAGRRNRRFRRGDLNEELGLLLLREIAAVAEVPRPEDFGIDAVATLLRRVGNDLFAEASFYVQLKSESVKEVVFEGDDVRWLRNLKLPLFFGIVSKRTGSLSLHPCHRLSQILLEMDYQRIVVTLGDSHKEEAEGERRIRLGDPILRWSTEQIDTIEFHDRAFSLLEEFLRIEQRNIDFRASRWFQQAIWVTNESVKPAAVSVMGNADPDVSLRPALQDMIPGLFAVQAHALMKANEDTAISACRELVSYMREHGIDPDPRDVFLRMVEGLRGLSEKQSTSVSNPNSQATPDR